MDTTQNTIENTNLESTNLEETQTGTAKIDSLTHDELKSYAQQLAAEFDTSATQLTSLQTDVDKYMRIAA